MVNVIWILENIKRHSSFYTELGISLLLSSVIQWKKHNPNTKTVLYVDILTYKFLSNINAIELWDKVYRCDFNEPIDKDIFWANSKLCVLTSIQEPSVVLDYDFLVYKSFEQFLKDKVIVGHEENGEDYYPHALDDYVRRTKHILNRPNHKSVNCCFNYYPNPAFARAYGSTSLELMRELTKLRAPNSKYLVYAEQLLLKHVLDLHNIEYTPLVTDIWHCQTNKWSKGTKGLIDSKEAGLYFRHYWMEKNKILDSSEGFNYINEINTLKKIISNYSDVDMDTISKLPIKTNYVTPKHDR